MLADEITAELRAIRQNAINEARHYRRTVALSDEGESAVLEFLNTLVLFPPDDTASNLDPGSRGTPTFPQRGHGSIRLTDLFNNPSDQE